jgi:hypothetical protein
MESEISTHQGARLVHGDSDRFLLAARSVRRNLATIVPDDRHVGLDCSSGVDVQEVNGSQRAAQDVPFQVKIDGGGTVRFDAQDGVVADLMRLLPGERALGQ